MSRRHEFDAFAFDDRRRFPLFAREVSQPRQHHQRIGWRALSPCPSSGSITFAALTGPPALLDKGGNDRATLLSTRWWINEQCAAKERGSERGEAHDAVADEPGESMPG